MTNTLKPTLQIGKYAFVDEGDLTVLYDMDACEPLLALTSVGEYALARLLVEKSQYYSSDEKESGERLYREEVSVEGRQLVLS